MAAEYWTREQVEKSVGPGNDSYVIPVNVTAEAGHRILSFERVEDILRRSDRVAAAECGCRTKLQRCSHTREGCLFLGPWYEEVVRDGYAEPVTREAALAILQRAYDDGLVIVAAEADEGPFKICCCCPCCCFMFAGLHRYGLEHALLRSDLVAAHDGDLCTACGTCAARCPFEAMRRTEHGLRLAAERCFGCGLCLGTCPTGAQTLVEK